MRNKLRYKLRCNCGDLENGIKLDFNNVYFQIQI